MDWFLIVVTVIVFFILVVINTYLIIIYQVRYEKRSRYYKTSC